MGGEARTAEQVIARLASGSHGVVTRRRLLEAGINARELERRQARGALIAVFRGVYRVGHTAPSVLATYMAAVLACGPAALLCGRAAAYLWELVKGDPPLPEVVCPGDRRVEGVRTVRARRSAREATSRRGIPVTTVAGTLVDLAAVFGDEALGRAFHQANVRYRTSPAEVEAVLARRPNAPGAAKLKRVIHGDTPVTLSRLESLFIAVLRRHNLPLPQTNKKAGTKYIDCRWPEHKLTVELQSYRYHNTRYAWEQDYHREREARARGDEFRRYTWTDVAEHPGPMLEDLRILLSASPGTRTARRASA